MTSQSQVSAFERPLPGGGQSIGTRFATKYGIHPSLLLPTLRETAFKLSGNKVASDAQVMSLLVVADQYNLNPFLKEIFAFDDGRGGIIPVVSVDGWVHIINDHKDYDGVEFAYSEKMVKVPHEGGSIRDKHAHEWVEARIFRKGLGRPIVIREYFDELYQAPRGQNATAGPWQTHPKRFQRHKALIQGARIAFGFGGIYDEDEAQRIEVSMVNPVNTGMAELQGDLRQLAAERSMAQPAALEHQQDALAGVSTRVDQREPVPAAASPTAEAGATAEAAQEPRGDESEGGASQSVAETDFYRDGDPGPIQWPT